MRSPVKPSPKDSDTDTTRALPESSLYSSSAKRASRARRSNLVNQHPGNLSGLHDFTQGGQAGPIFLGPGFHVLEPLINLDSLDGGIGHDVLTLNVKTVPVLLAIGGDSQVSNRCALLGP